MTEDIFYPLKEAAEILQRNTGSLRSIIKRGLIRAVTSDGVTGIMSSEIERYNKGPTKPGWYTYKDISPYLPELTKEEFDNWVQTARDKGNYPFHINKYNGNFSLKLPAAVRLYTDMTIGKE